MAFLLERLQALEKSIRLGIIGTGSIGKGLVLQAGLTPGIECTAIADIKLERAVACAEWLGREYAVVSTLAALHDAIRRGKLAVCEDGELIARCELMDVLIESSNAILAGAQYALIAFDQRKHVVMMNYEAALIFGPFLAQRAREQGVVFTVADGDQPTVLRRLIDEMEFMGFELVMAGNIKGFLDRYVNPTTIIPEADKRNLDYRMCASYTDGTKLAVEMAVLANGIGARVATPGMYGPRVKHVLDVFQVFDLDALWQDKQPIVDYVLDAKPTGGVFAIGHTGNKYQQETLAWFPPEMGPGPFYVFYRPYHLGHFETMEGVAEAFLDGRAVLRPDFGFQTNVYSYAKRDLPRGEALDGIGGYACYGVIENCRDDAARRGLPICLTEGVKLKHAVAKDAKILMEDVEYDPAAPEFQLFAQATKASNASL